MRNYLLIFLTSFCVYFFSWVFISNFNLNSLSVQSEDTVPAIFLPYAILQDKTLYLDNYYTQMTDRYPQPDDKTATPFYLKKVNDHYVSAFTIITPLLALPIYALGIAFGLSSSWNDAIFLAHLSSAFIMALSCVAFFSLLKINFSELGTKKNLLITFIYGFCTINFALVSQALWQHGTVQLFTILGLNYFLQYKNNHSYKHLYLAGLFFAIAVLARPTALFYIPILYILLIWDKTEFTKKTFYFALGAVLPLVFFAVYNYVYYLDFSNQGYSTQAVGSWLSPFPEGFLGTWISPSKGILVFSPVFLFGLYALYKNRAQTNLVFWLIILIHTLIMSKWKHWYGGWSFGYRMSSDILPFLTLTLVPFLQQPFNGLKKKLFILAVGFSFLVQIYGLIFFDGIWHAAYDNGFKNTSWLWSVKDSEWAFNARRILVKFGYLDKACPQCQ